MEAHGNHWECMIPDVARDISHWLPLVIQSGTPVGPLQRRRSGKGPCAARGLIYPKGDLGALVLITADSHGCNPENDLFSAYPFARRGVRHAIQITGIEEWAGGLEARIEGTVAGTMGVGFFDTLYFHNRHRYKVGQTHDFILSALAYQLSVIEPKPIQVTDPKVIERLHLAPVEAIDSPLGEGAQIQTKGAAILIPLEGWDVDDFYFSAPVSEVSEFTLENERLFSMKAKLAVVNDHDFSVVLYAASWVTGGCHPVAGDDVCGTLWLQGYLADTAIDSSCSVSGRRPRNRGRGSSQ